MLKNSLENMPTILRKNTIIMRSVRVVSERGKKTNEKTHHIKLDNEKTVHRKQ